MALSSRSRLYFSSAKDPVHFCDRDGLRLSALKLKSVSGSHDPLPLHGKVKAATAAAQKARQDIRLVEI